VKRKAIPGVSEGSNEAFLAQLEYWGVSLAGDGLETLASYAGWLASYEKANVVGTRDMERLWLEHVLDSLSCLLCEPLRSAQSLVDVGSGGGMPGIPLHIVLGFRRACLLEATGKKADFLDQASSGLRLEGLEIVNARAEELGSSEGYRERFEAATVRAVAPLPVISEYCLPLLAPGGAMIAMKARLDADELRAGEEAAEILGGELEEVLEVPFSPHVEPRDRRLILIRKVSGTPNRYPRRPGVPGKSPLGSAG